ncbi:MAG: hypothetical protein ACYC6C_13595 [Coriobacteriia bacterium]
MADAFLDELSPRYIREQRIGLTLDASVTAPAAFQSILVNVSYARTLPEHVVLPLILEVFGPSAQSYQRKEFGRSAPASFVFRPCEGGVHKVILREAAHNRWWGSLRVEVAGELLEAPRPT